MPPPTRPRATPDRHAERVARALAHVETHLDQTLDAPTLADKAAMSRHHFHRVFHAHVGCSVGDYVSWRRLQRACALLVSGSEPVLQVALEVGFESAQALAKAMRRELGATPTAVRRGDAAACQRLLQPWPLWPSPRPPEGAPTMQPHRFAELPAGLTALTATARGMVDHTMTRAARQAFGELAPALARAGLFDQARSWMAIVPDDPQGPDDPQCRYVAGVLFGYAMADGSGQGMRPELPLSGSLAWWPMAPGRHAVFLHVGPYSGLHAAWDAIYRDWLPASGETLRDDPPLEVMLNHPEHTPPAELRTEIWVPLA